MEIKVSNQSTETHKAEKKKTAKEKIDDFLSTAKGVIYKIIDKDIRAELQNFIRENGVPENIVFSKYAKGKVSLDDLSEIECEKILDSFLSCKKLQDKIAKYSINVKDVFKCNSVYELSESECKKYIKIIYDSSKSSKTELVNNLKVGYYFNYLDMDQKTSRYIKNSANFIKAAEYALNEMQKSGGKISKAQAAKNAKNYAIALDFQWDSIDDFKKAQAKNHDGIRERAKQYMKNHKLLDKMGKLGDSQKLYNATEDYFKSLKEALTKQVREKIAKNPNNEKAAIEWFNKIYAQNLGKLIVNTPSSELKILIKVARSVEGTIRAQVVSAALQRVKDEVSKKDAQMLADEAEKEGSIYEGLTAEQAGAVQNVITENQSKEAAIESVEQNNQKLVGFFKTVDVSFKEIIKKVKDNIPLTKEELELWNQHKDEYNTLLHRNAGAESGIAQNEDVSPQESAPIVAKMHNNLTKEGLDIANRELYVVINKCFVNNEAVSQERKEELKAFFDLISNGNFSLVNNNFNAKLNPPADPEKLFTGAQDDLGYKTQQGPITIETAKTNAAAIAQTIAAQTKAEDMPSTITVESSSPKLNKQVDVKTQSSSVLEKIAVSGLTASVLSTVTGSDLQELIQKRVASIGDAVKGFKNLTDSAKTVIVDTVSAMSSAQQSYVLNKTDNTTKTEIVQEGNLDYEKLNLDLDYNHKNLLEGDDAV